MAPVTQGDHSAGMPVSRGGSEDRSRVVPWSAGRTKRVVTGKGSCAVLRLKFFLVCTVDMWTLCNVFVVSWVCFEMSCVSLFETRFCVLVSVSLNMIRHMGQTLKAIGLGPETLG